MDKINWGELLTEKMKVNHHVAQNVADLTGISQPSVNRIAKGKQKNLKEETLWPLAEYLGITIKIHQDVLDIFINNYLQKMTHADRMTLLRLAVRLTTPAHEADQILSNLIEKII